MFLRRTQTTLPTMDQLLAPAMINFNIVKEDIIKKRQDSKAYHDKSAGGELTPINVGSFAYAKPPPRNRGNPWIYGEVIQKDNQRTYSMRTSHGTTIRRNRGQLKPAAPPPTHRLQPTAIPASERTTPNATPKLDSIQQACGNPQDQPAATASRSSHHTQQHNPASQCAQKPHEEDQNSRTIISTKGTFLYPTQADQIWENNQTPRKTRRLCRKLGSLYTGTMNTWHTLLETC